MKRAGQVVRLSSKGQIVIPVAVRRALKLKTGQAMAVKTGKRREIVFVPVEPDARDAEALLERMRAWTSRHRQDLVDELHRRRRAERQRLTQDG